jgi:tetratricopeptide (TPR) repeat protein
VVSAQLTAPADYRADVAAVCRARIEREAAADPESAGATTEVLTLRHREVMLTGGRPEEVLALGRAVDRAIGWFPAWPDLRLLRATLALTVHRPDVAAASLAAVPGLAEQPPGRVLAADIAQFSGDYAGARAGYLRAAREDPQWDTTARLAALATATGRFGAADDLYAAAEDEITAKQMRSFAWVRVQRGALAQALGDVDRAGRHLTDAERAYPGWWYVAVHRAALDAALGRYAQAAAGYREVLAEVDRPEYREAHGSVLAAAGDADGAADHHGRAVAAYLASAARGEVHYLHHLAAFYADVRPSHQAALTWARQDVALRRNGSTLSLLAWCLHRAGHAEEAIAVIDEAFALGAGDPLLQERARAIRESMPGGRR